jgi:GNAT superfamily N-acetyltransferase
MGSLLVRPLTPDDLPQLTELVRSRSEPPDDVAAARRVALLEWIAFHNPMAGGEPTYFVATDGDRLAGHLGRMPVRFNVGGSIERGYYVHDLYVHPESRQKGMGYFIASALYRAAEEASDAFCCYLGMTALNLEILRRRGHLETQAPRYARALTAGAFGRLAPATLRSVAGPVLAATAGVLDRLSVRRGRGVETAEVARFDSRFDELFRRIAPAVGISAYKSSAFLNWKYIDGPMKTAAVIAAHRDGELAGAVVLVTPRAPASDGFVADIIAPPRSPAVIQALCAAALARFRREGVGAVYCRSTDPRYSPVLRRCLFLRSRQTEAVLVANLDKSPDVAERVARSENWHLSYGESDGFMLAE